VGLDAEGACGMVTIVTGHILIGNDDILPKRQYAITCVVSLHAMLYNNQ